VNDSRERRVVEKYVLVGDFFRVVKEHIEGHLTVLVNQIMMLEILMVRCAVPRVFS
jgi:hypothetical protein